MFSRFPSAPAAFTSGYQVADGAEAHRSSTANGATLFIVD